MKRRVTYQPWRIGEGIWRIAAVWWAVSADPEGWDQDWEFIEPELNYAAEDSCWDAIETRFGIPRPAKPPVLVIDRRPAQTRWAA